jgi:predicted RNA methylase
MNQLTFWDLGTSDDLPLAERHAALSKLRAAKCRTAAAALQKLIDRKHESADRFLSQPPTRKRLAEADRMRKQANRFAQIQATLAVLGERHENGTLDPRLVNVTNAAVLERMLFAGSLNCPLRKIFDSVGEPEASLSKIPGYFPTPESVAEELITMADLQPGQRILEPSAGSGSLIDAAMKHCANLQISFCELNLVLLDILRDKYEKNSNIHFLDRNFLELETHRPGERFDRILMNPPFERGQDIEHVLRAYSMLKIRGRLVSLVSAGALGRQDKKGTEFRRFLEAHNAVIRDVPAGAFKASGTSVAAKFVAVSKSK